MYVRLQLQSQLEALGGTQTADLLELNFEKDELLKTKDEQISAQSFEIGDLKAKLKALVDTCGNNEEVRMNWFGGLDWMMS